VRPGRAQDLAAVVGLWEQEVRDGRRELVPADGWLRRALAGFDWEAGSRVAEGRNGGLEGAVLVTSRSYSIGTITRVEPAVAASSDKDLRRRLVEWGLALSRAAGAAGAQVWLPRGQGADLGALGLQPVRPWWRMDRSLDGELPVPEPVPGYELVVGPGVAPGVWADVHNRSFADHWRYSIRTEDELMAWRPAELALLAVAEDAGPAAVTLGQIETYAQDARAQPVGLVGSVGTLPGHRRKGLAGWLVAESLLRLRQAGARSASLYVDGFNATRAPDLYRRLRFKVAFETEVWEATFG
jgi:ribosomal protein S18 acetylase RimI-like enzyme